MKINVFIFNLISFIMLFIFSSCDSIRVVRVKNLSSEIIVLKTDLPHKISYYKDSDGVKKEKLIENEFIQTLSNRSVDFNRDLQIEKTPNELIIKLNPNEYFELANGIGPGFIKIKEWDLNHSKLSIIRSKDTINAKSRKEIINLIHNPKTKYRRKDKSKIPLNNKFCKNIILRD